MEIVLCTDNNYVMPAGVMMTSMSMNNKEVNFHVIISEDLSPENCELLKRTAEKFNNRISFYKVEKNLEMIFPMGNEGMAKYISVSSYYRLLISRILSNDIHKVIYLDCDMIVRKSLESLWNADISDFAVGVVHDMDEIKHCGTSYLPYPMTSGYFNAGMLLINLDYWRENNVIEKFYDFMVSYRDIIRFHDQDVLNSVFYDCKKWLPLTYNFQSGFLFNIIGMANVPQFIKTEILNTQKDPSIIHFSISPKPWKYTCIHPQRFVWEYYKRKSLWKNVNNTPSLSLREEVSLFLRKNNFWFFKKGIHRNIYRRVLLRK